MTPEEARATVRQHVQKLSKDRSCGSEDILTDIQTDTQTQTDIHTDVLITILRNRAAGEVKITKIDWSCFSANVYRYHSNSSYGDVRFGNS